MNEEEIKEKLKNEIEFNNNFIIHTTEEIKKDYARQENVLYLGVLNLLDKKDKVINLIVESWKQDDVRSVEDIKEYFYKKVEEENE